MSHVLIVEPRPQTADILLSLSENTYLCRPEGAKRVDALECLQKWPFPYQRSWIVSGGTRAPQIPDDQWFSDSSWSWLEDCLEWLEAESEWAMLSFFTSFHTNYLVLVISGEAHYERLVVSDAFRIVENYSLGCPMRNATFTHDGEEGRVVLELARESSEPCYLLCHFEGAERWCRPFLDSLKMSTSWGAPYKSRYELFRVTDESPFKALWDRTGEDCAVAAAVFANDLDVGELRRVTADNFGATDEVLGTASWALRVVYGGGSDEHHAHFRAQDGQVTDRLWELVLGSRNRGTKPLSRF